MILVELRRALKGKLKLSDERVSFVEAVVGSVPILPRPSRPAAIDVRDSSDRWIVATAVGGKADALGTGARDLLDVRDAAPLPIVDPRSFRGRCSAVVRSEPASRSTVSLVSAGPAR